MSRASDVTNGRPLVIRPEYEATALVVASLERKVERLRRALAGLLQATYAELDIEPFPEDAEAREEVAASRAQLVRQAREALSALRATTPR